MKRKKEIIIIAGIVILSIILIFLPIIINNTNNNNKEEIKEVTDPEISNTITIKIYGEITYRPLYSIDDDDITNEFSFEAKSGITYGEIINRINNFLTKYSIIENNFTKRYFESSSIKICSSDLSIEEIDINEGKININTATFNQLMGLTGIGTKRANKIIDYIKNNGSISSFKELSEILGVSDGIIEEIKREAFL